MKKMQRRKGIAVA